MTQRAHYLRRASNWFGSCAILCAAATPFVIIGWRVTTGCFIAGGLLCLAMAVVDLRWAGRAAMEPDPREGRGCDFTRTGTCVAQPVCPPGTKVCQPGRRD